MATTTYDSKPSVATSGPPGNGSLLDRIQGFRLGSRAGRLGVVVVGIGLLVIGLGWNGMSGSGGEVNHVPNLSAQLPFLVSGGILGLALVVFGAALLIAHNGREDRMHLEAKLGEILDALAAGTTTTGEPASSGPAPASTTSTRTRRETGQFLAGPTAFHRRDCRLVEGRDDLAAVTRAAATASDLKPCRVCKPS